MAQSKKSGYLAGLDGWRAFAILPVLFNHDYTIYIGSTSMRYWQNMGGNGVLLFFAISGILICTRLLEEETLLGRLNLRGFYTRRILRIQPAAFGYLTAIAALVFAGWIFHAWKFWFGSIFLYRNYQLNVLDPAVGTAGFFTGHFWTLAVEEHFYILLSLFLFFVPRRRRLTAAVLFALTLLWPHIANHFPLLDGTSSGGRHTGFQLQFLVFPALLALLLRHADVRAWADRWLTPWAAYLGTFALYLVTRYMRFHVPWHSIHVLLPTGIELLVRVWPFWIIATMLHPASVSTRFLELPLLRWIGRISYSLYLWHILFFRGTWPLAIPQLHSPLLYLTHRPWNYICAFIAASLSFYVLERPLMRLGHRLAPPATPGRKDLGGEPVATPIA